MNQIQLLKYGEEILRKNYIYDPDIKSKRLIEFVLQQSRQKFIMNSTLEVTSKKEKEYKEKLEEIIQGKPLQYITNNQPFMGSDFYVDESVLIPQPDTEVLVLETLNFINTNKQNFILDLCTGSGAIAISIAKCIQKEKIKDEDNDTKIIASDISEKALKVAKQNVINNNVENIVKLVQSDMFSNLDEKFDIIVSNPPYIERNALETLSKEVRQEPVIALDGGKDGLTFYRIILEQAEHYLKESGYLLFEIGYDQGDKIKELYNNLKEENKCNLEIVTKEPIKDLADNDRVMIFKKFRK